MTARERAKRHPVVWAWQHRGTRAIEVSPWPLANWRPLRVRLVPLRDYREMTK